jgi:hypothetical protein
VYNYLILNKDGRTAPSYQATTDHFLTTVIAPSATRAIKAYLRKHPECSVEAKPVRELTATQRAYVEKNVPVETVTFEPDRKSSGTLFSYVITVKNEVVFSLQAKGRKDAITQYREQVDCPNPDAIAMTQNTFKRREKTHVAYS